MPTDKGNGGLVVGIAIISSLFIGFVSFIAAVFAFFNNNWIGIGVCLIAAALAVGLLANAVLRN